MIDNILFNPAKDADKHVQIFADAWRNHQRHIAETQTASECDQTAISARYTIPSLHKLDRWTISVCVIEAVRLNFVALRILFKSSAA